MSTLALGYSNGEIAEALLAVDKCDMQGLKTILKGIIKEINVLANNQEIFEHNQFQIIRLIQKSNPNLPPIDQVSYEHLVGDGSKGE